MKSVGNNHYVSSHWMKSRVSKTIQEYFSLVVEKKLDERVKSLKGEFSHFKEVEPHVDKVARGANLKQLLERETRLEIQEGLLDEKNDGLLMQWNEFTEMVKNKLQPALHAFTRGEWGERVSVFEQTTSTQKNEHFEVTFNPSLQDLSTYYDIKIEQLADGESLQTREFLVPSAAPIVKNNCDSNSSLCIKAGELSIGIKDNRLISKIFTKNIYDPIAGSDGQFGTGIFYLNNKQIKIEKNDSLKQIIDKINLNQRETGIIAESYYDENQEGYFLVLSSKKFGLENKPFFYEEEGNNVIKDFLQGDQRYEKISLVHDDSLANIARKINSKSSIHNIRADLLEEHGRCKLQLKSLITGKENKISEKDFALFGQLIQGKLAQNAKVKIDNIPMEYASNHFQFNEMAFKLLSKTKQENLYRFQLERDDEKITRAVEEFLIAYVELQNFLANRVEDQEKYKGIYDNFPASVKFTDIIEKIGIGQSQINFYELEKVGIFFKKKELSHYRNLLKFQTVDDHEKHHEIKSLKDISHVVKFDKKFFQKMLKENFNQVRGVFSFFIENKNEQNASSPSLSVEKYSYTSQYNLIKEINFDIDSSRISKKYTMSKPLNNDHRFKEGRFMLNGEYIEVKESDSMDTLVRNINNVKEKTGIVVKRHTINEKDIIIMEENSDLQKKSWPPILCDYDTVLQGIFDAEDGEVSDNSRGDLFFDYSNVARLEIRKLGSEVVLKKALFLPEFSQNSVDMMGNAKILPINDKNNEDFQSLAQLEFKYNSSQNGSQKDQITVKIKQGIADFLSQVLSGIYNSDESWQLKSLASETAKKRKSVTAEIEAEQSKLKQKLWQITEIELLYKEHQLYFNNFL